MTRSWCLVKEHSQHTPQTRDSAESISACRKGCPRSFMRLSSALVICQGFSLAITNFQHKQVAGLDRGQSTHLNPVQRSLLTLSQTRGFHEKHCTYSGTASRDPGSGSICSFPHPFPPGHTKGSGRRKGRIRPWTVRITTHITLPHNFMHFCTYPRNKCLSLMIRSPWASSAQDCLNVLHISSFL